MFSVTVHMHALSCLHDFKLYCIYACTTETKPCFCFACFKVIIMQSEGVRFDREACGFSVEGVSLLFVLTVGFTVAYFTEIMQKAF